MFVGSGLADDTHSDVLGGLPCSASWRRVWSGSYGNISGAACSAGDGIARVYAGSLEQLDEIWGSHGLSVQLSVIHLPLTPLPPSAPILPTWLGIGGRCLDALPEGWVVESVGCLSQLAKVMDFLAREKSKAGQQDVIGRAR